MMKIHERSNSVRVVDTKMHGMSREIRTAQVESMWAKMVWVTLRETNITNEKSRLHAGHTSSNGPGFAMLVY